MKHCEHERRRLLAFYRRKYTLAMKRSINHRNQAEQWAQLAACHADEMNALIVTDDASDPRRRRQRKWTAWVAS